MSYKTGFYEGRLGIGLSSTMGMGDGNPRYPLDINGDIRLTGSIVNGSGQVLSLVPQESLWTIGTTDITYTGGNVGIGTQTPQTLLHISKDGGDALLRIQTKTGNDKLAGIEFWTDDSSSNSGDSWAATRILSSFTGTTYETAYLKFQTHHSDTTTYNDTMIIKGDSVGIGTTSPAEKLQVNGRLRIEGDSTSSGIWFIGNGVENDNGSAFFGRGGNNFAGTGFWFSSWTHAFLDNGNVGIGTTSPYSKLEITAGADTSHIRISEGSHNGSSSTFLYPALTYYARQDNARRQGDPFNQRYGASASISFTDRPGTYTYVNAVRTSDIVFHTSTSYVSPNLGHYPIERMRITAEGNVGIGTTSPSTLLVVGEDGGGNGTNTPGIHMKCKAPIGQGNNLCYCVGQDSSHHVFLTYYAQSNVADGYASLSTYGGLNPLCLQHAGGNVGIGTTSPDDKLHVQGGGIHVYCNSPRTGSDAAQAGQAGNANIFMDCNNNSTSTAKNGIIWKSKYSLSPNTYTKTSAGIYFQPENNYFRGGLAFYTNGAASETTNATEKMRINMNGRVGIGTTSPGCPLHVDKGNTTGLIADFQSNDWGNSGIVVRTKAGGDGDGYIELRGGNVHAHGKHVFIGCTRNGSDVYNSNIVFKTRHNEGSYEYHTAAERMRIQYNGNVGIGTTSPGFPLEISGDVTGPYIGQVGYMTSSGHPTTSGANNDPITLKTSNVIWSQGYILASSDRRIKENIVDVSDNLALEMVRNIPVKYYEYKDKLIKGNEKTIGFIAQEVKEIIPMAVSIQKNIIPNVMRKLENISWEEIKDNSDNIINYKLTTDLSDCSGVKYRFYVSNDISGNDEIMKEVIGNNDNSFTFDTSYNNVFCYGKEVDDFHTLDKQKLFALNFSATQELDKKVIALENENAELKAELAAIKQHLGI